MSPASTPGDLIGNVHDQTGAVARRAASDGILVNADRGFDDGG
jgi:hypothetical protein